jgi:predicted ester cyclase
MEIMSLEDNKAIVRRAYEDGLNNRDWSIIDEVFDPDYVCRVPGQAPIQGRDDFKASLASFMDAFPDIQFVVEDQLAEGDKVTTRWSARGTNTAEFRGFPLGGTTYPPSGNKVEFGANDIYLIKDGKIVEEWNTLEPLVVLKQIGAFKDST